MVADKLIYVDDSLPGITRKGAGKGWAYYSPKGELIRDRAEKVRLNAIALPPAYKDAWYCPAHNGHILATGYDDAGRKQYRYHPDFRAMRDGEKFDRCIAFGTMLPLLRKRVAEDVQAPALTKERVIAGIVRLLDCGFIRIGNDAYRKRNKSYGATTLRQRHATVDGTSVHLEYKGKSGQDRTIDLDDADVSAIIEELQDLPGQDLFQYLDEEGDRHRVASCDVNAYLAETMGEHFTAKNFRTWHGSVLAFEVLARSKGGVTITKLLEHVSDRLGNTPAIARGSYIHPAVIELVDGQEEWRASLRMPRSTRYLAREERALLALLESAPSAGELLAA